MKTNSPANRAAMAKLHPRKPIKYWTVNIKTNWITDAVNEIDRHESIAILRGKYGNVGVVYKAVR